MATTYKQDALRVPQGEPKTNNLPPNWDAVSVELAIPKPKPERVLLGYANRSYQFRFDDALALNTLAIAGFPLSNSASAERFEPLAQQGLPRCGADHPIRHQLHTALKRHHSSFRRGAKYSIHNILIKSTCF